MARLRRGCRVAIGFTTLFAFCANLSVAEGSVINDGVSCLATQQAPAGSWGDPNGSAFRDTTVVADALVLVRTTNGGLANALSFLQSAAVPNQDYLSRQIATFQVAGTSLPAAVDALFSGQNDETFNPAGPNYPDGGWGVAPEYATETLTTTLAVRALQSAGLARGLTVVKAVVPPGGENSHEFTLQAGASNLAILLREASGSVQVHVDLPSGGTGSFAVQTNITYPKLLVGIPPQEGMYTLRVESIAGGPNTYSLEARFLDGDSFDVSLVTRALSYLGFGQNPDGSWGVSRGEDGSLMVTAEVVRTLAAEGGRYAPAEALDAAADWLQGLQNPDGGFGSQPGVSTVYETALAALAISAADPSSPALDPAKGFLLGNQQPGGCWNDEGYSTGMALHVLAPSFLCRVDVDKNSVAEVATDVVYIARRLLGLVPVPPTFRVLDPTIPPDVEISAKVDAVGSSWDVDTNGTVDVATDVVYIARHLLGLVPVPPSWRLIDPTIPSNEEIATNIDALCP